MSSQLNLSGGDGSESRPLTLADVEKYWSETVLDETTTAEQHRACYARAIASAESIKAELSKKKVAELKKMAGYGSRDKKGELVEQVWHNILQDFSLASMFSYSPFSESFEKAVERYVSKVTDDSLADYRRARAEAAERRRQQLEHYKKSLDNPETKAEFEFFCRVKGERALSTEQLARYDELRGRAAIQRRTDELVKKSVVSKVDLGGVEWSIVKGYHTRRLCDVWIVVLSDRVDRELYRELESKARQLGGWYGKKWGTNPGGFNFTDEGQAKKFYGLKDGDASKLDRMLERRDRVRDNAVEHFDGLADRMDGRADDVESKDRNLNTARRVGIAERALEGARETRQMAGTLRNHAAALASRLAAHLDRIRWRTHAETLDRLLRRADWQVEKAIYPWPEVNRGVLRDVIAKLDGTKGYTMLARRVRRIAKEDELARHGEHTTLFNSHHAANLLIELYTGVRRHCASYDAERIKWALGDYRRMKLMKLESLPELRAAMREHIGRRASLPAESEALRLVKSLVASGMVRGYVPTPRDVAELMLVHGDPQPGMLALEPQIGDGQLAAVLAEKHPDVPILGIEINERLSTLAQRRGFEVVTKDFLSVTPEPRFDLILSNPPFHDGLDGEHIQHEYKFLTRDTGRLVSVVNERIFHRQDRKAIDFRAWLADVGGEDFELPEGSFLESDVPTDWDARLVVIDQGQREVMAA
jgi:hypothetical protein